MNKLLILPLFFLLALILAAGRADAAGPLDAARAALLANDLPGADAALAPLTGADGRDAAAFHLLGQVRERQQRVADAVAAYEQAAQLDAARPEYFSSLGIALSRRMAEVGFMQQAMIAGKMKKAFNKSVELDPRHVPGLIGLARYYANAPEIAGGSMEKAAEFADRVRALDPFSGEMELGNVAERDEKFADALTHFEAAAALKPAYAGALNACGRQLARLGRKDEARARFEAALKLNPDFAAAKQGLADLDKPAG